MTDSQQPFNLERFEAAALQALAQEDATDPTVHTLLQCWRHGQCSLPDALVIAVKELARQNKLLVDAAVRREIREMVGPTFIPKPAEMEPKGGEA